MEKKQLLADFILDENITDDLKAERISIAEDIYHNFMPFWQDQLQVFFLQFGRKLATHFKPDVWNIEIPKNFYSKYQNVSIYKKDWLYEGTPAFSITIENDGTYFDYLYYGICLKNSSIDFDNIKNTSTLMQEEGYTKEGLWIGWKYFDEFHRRTNSSLFRTRVLSKSGKDDIMNHYFDCICDLWDYVGSTFDTESANCMSILKNNPTI